MFIFDPYSSVVDADPFPLYAQLRDEYPCFWSPEAGMWVLSRYADILGAGLDWKTYSSARGNLMTELPNRAGATLGTTDPPRHDRLRGLIQHAFMNPRYRKKCRQCAAWQRAVRFHHGVFVQVYGTRAFRGAWLAAGR
jgi:cytochrome P450